MYVREHQGRVEWIHWLRNQTMRYLSRINYSMHISVADDEKAPNVSVTLEYVHHSADILQNYDKVMTSAGEWNAVNASVIHIVFGDVSTPFDSQGADFSASVQEEGWWD